MAHDAPLRSLREKRDIRDYDPSIIRSEFKKMCLDKSREQSKQVELSKAIALASHYEKLMDSTRLRSIRQAVIHMRELDTVENRIDSIIETFDQITNEVDNEIDCCATNFKKAFTVIDTPRNGLYQNQFISVQLKKQQKTINAIADQFSNNIRLINSIHDNFAEYKSLLKKCRTFDVDVLAFSKLVRLQGSKIIPVKEYWSVEDLKTLPIIVDELNRVIKNLVDLRTVCKLISPTSLPEEKDIAKLIHQAEKLRRILEIDKTITKLPISIIS
uniref:Uncharacterized protein n=1 Tax=Onchocerca volvulus TaxID=6282 RepID=A0A8R1TMP2_ONCVO